MDVEPTILIVGGGSRVGTSLARRLGARALSIVRGEAREVGQIAVKDYREIPPRLFTGIDRVVNCVGITGGSTALMQQINIDMPLALTMRARDQGVAQLIHISSFSVYGRSPEICRETPAVPSGAYGRSKLEADTALAALTAPGFSVTVLRLPLVYAEDDMGKLGSLMRAWLKTRTFPIPRQDVRRSMIGVELTADVIAGLLDRAPYSGVVFAADPTPFSYRAAAAASAERLYCLPLPRLATRLARGLAPGLGDRLFCDSALRSTDNLAEAFHLPSRLYSDIAGIQP